MRNQGDRVIHESHGSRRGTDESSHYHMGSQRDQGYSQENKKNYRPPELQYSEESGAGYRYTTDGSEVYDQAIERLTSLRAIIEREYPRMKGIQKRIEDVKYYFDLG